MTESNFRAQLKSLRDHASENYSKDEVLSALEKIIENTDNLDQSTCGDLRKEVQKLSEFIIKTRLEVAQIQPELIHQEHIPVATDELDAVVGATEEATGKILDAVESIEVVAKGLDGAARSTIEEQASIIYQACSFQDITGQRITKVVKALKDIENTVMSLVSSFGGKISARPSTVKANGQKIDGDKDLLNGPQLPNKAHSQEDIDRLFESS